MTYHMWKVRTGRNVFFPPTVNTSVLLEAAAVGCFLVVFAILFTFWYYTAANFPY